MKIALLLVVLLELSSCRQETDSPDPAPQLISSDQQLFGLVTREQTFAGYVLLPNADSVVSGTLNGSNAHQPMVRVVLNPTALSVLPGGRAPAGLSFPDGSVIVKEVRIDGTPSLYALLYKEQENPFSNGGWLWAEFKPDGTVVYSIQNRGEGCINCHAREQGPGHDHVRSFERQHP